MKLIESLKKRKFLLFNIFFTLYIGINLIGGERGLISYFDKKKLLEELEIKEKMLTNKLQNLERKISLVKNNDFIRRDRNGMINTRITRCINDHKRNEWKQIIIFNIYFKYAVQERN